MKIGTTLRIERETNNDTINGFSGMNVQPFFRSKSFYGLNHKNLEQDIKNASINILSLHYPSVRDKFIENIEMLRDIYQQRLFTVHPHEESLNKFLKYLSSVENKILELGVELSFENMPTANCWSNYPSNLYKIANEFSFASVTYDTTHLPKDIETIAGLEKGLEKTKIIHLSNVCYCGSKEDHLPIDSGERDLHTFLKYLKMNSFAGQVIIEYRDHNPAILKKEVEKINNLLDN